MQPETPKNVKKDPTQIDRYDFFQPISVSIGQTTSFCIGAAIGHHPVHKGALTALAGGAIVGTAIGIIGYALKIKKKNTSFKLMVCAGILDLAPLVATMPVGENVLPFIQDLSLKTKIEDQLIGTVVITSSLIFFVLLIAICCCAQFLQDPKIRKATYSFISEQFSLIELFFAAAKYLTFIDAQAVVIDTQSNLPINHQGNPNSSNYATPVPY